MTESRHIQPAPFASADDARVRVEADDIAMSFPDRDLLFLADQLDRRPSAYDQGPAAGRAVAAELRRRHDAGLRSWPVTSALPATSAGFELIDDDIPW